MMVKRKLDCTVDQSSADYAYNRFINPTQLYISCEKSEGPYLAEPGLMADRLTGCQANKI